jgi:hypothetical protein
MSAQLDERMAQAAWDVLLEMRDTDPVGYARCSLTAIDAAYVAANAPVVKEQLQKAGVRLVHLLDAALAK